MLVTVMFLKPCVYMGKHLMHIFVNLNYKMGNFDRQVGTFIYRTCVSLKLRLRTGSTSVIIGVFLFSNFRSDSSILKPSHMNFPT